MIVLNFISNYKLSMRGADGTVDMWVSKTHAARRASSILALPTMTWKEWIYFLVRSLKFILSECRIIVVLCRINPTTGFKKLYRA